MLLILSPAKTLDFTPPDPSLPATAPQMAAQTKKLIAIARKLTASDLKRLMNISDKLAELNVARFGDFDPKGSQKGVQAALAFAGDVYDGLEARTLDIAALEWAQARVRILSGLYGLLRPLDRIQPYRLEMGVRLATDRGATLYDFWGDVIAKALRDAAQGHADPTVVNLASQEYFGAVDAKALKRPIVTCHFKEESEAGVRIISFYAKIARGLMARYAIDHRLDQAEALKGFDRAGYAYVKSLSTDTDWTFVRPQPPSKTSARFTDA
jgi:cytoplasmic iron level regulating protein YaaA (DUF328/UPF0246 family)